METIINELQKIQQSVVNKKNDKQSEYDEMIQALVNELLEKTELIRVLENSKPLPMTILKMKKEWQRFMTDFTEILSKWLCIDFETVKKAKLYLEMEELMADIDDWIEETAEESFTKLSYIENWDIGVFF